MYPTQKIAKCAGFLLGNFVFSLSLVNCAQAQSKCVIENYNYVGQPGTGSIVPMIHFETNKNWYAELRYNYEDDQTISFFGGKSFKGGNDFEYTITPLVGFSVGNFTGVSLANNIESSWHKFYLSSQTQFSVATKATAQNFFFTWSEIGYTITKHFFSGLAVQYTIEKLLQSFEPGVVVGLEAGNFSFPLYIFSPFKSDRYVVAGVNYQFNIKRKK